MRELVFFASVLMRKVMASPVRATVLFATETGKSEALARDLAALFSYAFNTKVVCMEQYKANTLEEEQLLLVVTSTFDNGDCPSNGQTMKKSLFMMKELGHTFRYAVFGLGSSMYPQFCAFAHDIDQKLSHLGASQLAPTGEGDELSGQEDAFRSWAVQTFRVSSSQTGRSALMPNLCGSSVPGVMTSVRCRVGGWARTTDQSCFPNPTPTPTKKKVTPVFVHVGESSDQSPCHDLMTPGLFLVIDLSTSQQ
eukprot:XP_017453287.1 PREDICTED: nitric oxide synthase, inducible-like [Rattus norvegicus]